MDAVRAWVPYLVLFACNSVTETPPDAAAPPAVVAVSPADGDTGVLEDARIVIEFSAPMNLAATEAAYQSPELPAAAVSMTWNGAGDTLTITPSDPLPYASGDLSVAAETFTFSLMTSAADLAGNPLAEPLDVTFSTARNVAVEVAAVTDLGLSTHVRGDGSIADLATLDVGDAFLDPGEVFFRGLVTFDLSALPEIFAVRTATFNAEQQTFAGDPYTNLGEVHIHDAEFAQVSLAAAESPGADLGVFSADPTEELKTSVDIAGAVAADASTGRTQFLLKFSQDDNGDGTTDRLRIPTSTAFLDLELLVR